MENRQEWTRRQLLRCREQHFSCGSEHEGADDVVGIINIEWMDDGNIPVKADDENHEDGRGLEDLLEWIKETNICQHNQKSVEG